MKTELPLTAMSTSGKLLAEKAIEGVKERGHTNLSGGLLAALEALYRQEGTYYISLSMQSYFLQDIGNRGLTGGVCSPVH